MPLRRKPSDEIYRALQEATDTPVIVGAAREAFARSYPDVKLQRLVVVIAAFNEAANIGAVLDEVPDQIADIPTSMLVIDDGSTDGHTSSKPSRNPGDDHTHRVRVRRHDNSRRHTRDKRVRRRSPGFRARRSPTVVQA